MPNQTVIAAPTTIITIPQACLLTRLTYNQVMRRVFRGELPAHQDQGGRWWLAADHVERLATELRGQQDEPPAA
jgi:hypothetical protein